MHQRHRHAGRPAGRFGSVTSDTTAWRLLERRDARHWAHARVEDRIRYTKDTGLGRSPSRDYAINNTWLVAVMIAADFIAWTQTIVVQDGPELARAEAKTLRYGLLHVAARTTRSQRDCSCGSHCTKRWAVDLVDAFRRVHALPGPAT